MPKVWFVGEATFPNASIYTLLTLALFLTFLLFLHSIQHQKTKGGTCELSSAQSNLDAVQGFLPATHGVEERRFHVIQARYSIKSVNGNLAINVKITDVWPPLSTITVFTNLMLPPPVLYGVQLRFSYEFWAIFGIFHRVTPIKILDFLFIFDIFHRMTRIKICEF